MSFWLPSVYLYPPCASEDPANPVIALNLSVRAFLEIGTMPASGIVFLFAISQEDTGGALCVQGGV